MDCAAGVSCRAAALLKNAAVPQFIQEGVQGTLCKAMCWILLRREVYDGEGSLWPKLKHYIFSHHAKHRGQRQWILIVPLTDAEREKNKQHMPCCFFCLMVIWVFLLMYDAGTWHLINATKTILKSHTVPGLEGRAMKTVTGMTAIPLQLQMSRTWAHKGCATVQMAAILVHQNCACKWESSVRLSMCSPNICFLT